MPKLTITSTFASSFILGDPGIMTITMAPKETKGVEVTDVQLRQLKEQLDRLVAAKWMQYSVTSAVYPDPVPVAAASAPAPAPAVVAPPPQIVAPEPPAPLPATETVAETEPVVTDPPADEPPAASAPAAKPSFFDKKNRNR